MERGRCVDHWRKVLRGGGWRNDVLPGGAAGLIEAIKKARGWVGARGPLAGYPMILRDGSGAIEARWPAAGSCVQEIEERDGEGDGGEFLPGGEILGVIDIKFLADVAVDADMEFAADEFAAKGWAASTTRAAGGRIEEEAVQDDVVSSEFGDANFDGTFDVPAQVEAVLEIGEGASVEDSAGSGVEDFDFLRASGAIPIAEVSGELVGLAVDEIEIDGE